MKKLLLLASVFLIQSLAAEPLVVFAKGDSLDLAAPGAVPPPKDATRAAFLASVQADLAHPAAFAAPFALIAPPEWGKTIPGATGALTFHATFRGGFVVHVSLDGLAPGHRYILTLNGNPKLAGNDRLVDLVPGMAIERYFDFQAVTTDAHGRYDARYAIALAAGPYDVRFYVKDTADFKIVLYHDYFKFTVE